MDYEKGNINNQGNKEDRILLSEEGHYCYPCSKATYSILEFGSVTPHLKKGMIISTITDETIEYNTGINRYIGLGCQKANSNTLTIIRLGYIQSATTTMDTTKKSKS